MNLRDELKAVLDNTTIDEMLAPTVDFFLASMYAKIMGAPVYIWAENELPIFVRLFKQLGLNVRNVISLLPKDFDAIDDIEIIAPKDILKYPGSNKFFFLNATDYEEESVQKMLSALDRLGAFGIYVLTQLDRKKLIGYTPNRFDLNRIQYYQAHKNELLQFFDQLADERSKRTMVEYMRSYLTNSTYRGEQIPTRYKYFFGGKDELLYERMNDECWVNCGASVGDTIFSFVCWGLKAKKIYAFEGNPKEYQKLLNNISLLPSDKRAMIEPINEMIDEQTDFNSILEGGRCTLLNADIEGNELDLLKSMRNVIRKDRPVMAICVYHLKEDLVDIPTYFRENCEDYVYHLRKYSSGWLQNYKQNHELVLYAVPRERSLL